MAGALAALAFGLGACGGGEEGTAGGGDADRAFLESMIPHHESAIEMATLAKRRAEHPQVMELADAIVTAQSREIRQIEGIHQRLFDEKVSPNADAHEDLGLMESTAELKRVKPFDEAFIDMMVGHHQGAIRMARAVHDQSDDDEVRSLAKSIVSAQSKEIEQMNEWRRAWYGAPSPAGGVPNDGAGSSEGSMEEHDAH